MSGQADAIWAGPLRRVMRGRAPTEGHRASTPLELLFEPAFVVGVSQAAARFTMPSSKTMSAPGRRPMRQGSSRFGGLGSTAPGHPHRSGGTRPAGSHRCTRVLALGFNAPALGIGGAVLGMGLTMAANLFTTTSNWRDA